MTPYTTVQKKFQKGVMYVQSGIVGAVSAGQPMLRRRKLRNCSDSGTSSPQCKTMTSPCAISARLLKLQKPPIGS